MRVRVETTKKVFEECEYCGGTGLNNNDGFAQDCRNCRGNGETLIEESKTAYTEEREINNG